MCEQQFKVFSMFFFFFVLKIGCTDVSEHNQRLSKSSTYQQTSRLNPFTDLILINLIVVVAPLCCFGYRLSFSFIIIVHLYKGAKFKSFGFRLFSVFLCSTFDCCSSKSKKVDSSLLALTSVCKQAEPKQADCGRICAHKSIYQSQL